MPPHIPITKEAHTPTRACAHIHTHARTHGAKEDDADEILVRRNDLVCERAVRGKDALVPERVLLRGQGRLERALRRAIFACSAGALPRVKHPRRAVDQQNRGVLARIRALKKTGNVKKAMSIVYPPVLSRTHCILSTLFVFVVVIVGGLAGDLVLLLGTFLVVCQQIVKNNNSGKGAWHEPKVPQLHPAVPSFCVDAGAAAPDAAARVPCVADILAPKKNSAVF
jgi:hypothetical protein